jgi:hypothetical protein
VAEPEQTPETGTEAVQGLEAETAVEGISE